ncbi:hypothetical protein [Ensifer canadensis]|uniref:hypothetical protein n=1 Tax=Ensifer canadensis TaxID=555315 RepID=UPI0035E3D1A6
MRTTHTILIAVPLWFGVGSALAQECDPKDHLVRDVFVFDENIETEFSLYKERREKDEKEGKTSIGFTYEGIKFDGDNATRAYSSLNSLLKLQYSDKQKRSLYESELPQGAVEAYMFCLSKQGEISHEFSNNVLASKKFFYTINWHPNVIPEQKEAEAVFDIIGGKFSANGGDTITVPIVAGGSAYVKVERELFEPTEIKVQIRGENHGIVLPAKSKFRIASEILSSNPTGDPEKRGRVKTVETTGPRPGQPVCAQLPNEQQDAKMIPGSGTIIYHVNNRNNVRTIEEWTKETDRGVCFTGGCNFYEVWGAYCHVEYDIQIGVWRAIDISKGGQLKPADMADPAKQNTADFFATK